MSESAWAERFARLVLLLLAAGAGTSGCTSEQAAACQRQFASAQAIVLQVHAEDMASVSASVAAVEQALATCTAAGQSAEADELGKARATLVSHRERLSRRAEMLEKRRRLSPEELAALLQKGDPGCPRGQGYRHGQSGRHVRCVGPQPIDMPRAEAEAHFARLGHRRLDSPSSELHFEYGAERIVFAYADAAGAEPPACVTLQPPPDRSWQEAVARLTGVAPRRLKPGRPVPSSRGDLALALAGDERAPIVRIGTCAAR